ncbi:MAG: response regulator [Gammaproteobacteria bacterium]|nr:MAG: response regulator [Gammaproteobacteria bacterium]
MPHTLLIIDRYEQHRRIVRHFMEKLRPMDQLYEYDPSELGIPEDDFDWSQYDLIIMDTELGEYDGLKWQDEFRYKIGFPPVIFLSSVTETDSRSETDLVITAMRQGVRDFLFKKQLKAEQLHNSVAKILDQPEFPQAVQKSPPRKQLNKERADQEKAVAKGEQQQPVVSSKSTKEQPLPESTPANLEQTLNEVSLAMVMMEARTKWPFTIEDILAGNAKVDHYKVLSYQGKGHCGASFRARNMKTDEIVAIKMITHARNGDPEVLKKFGNEFAMMKKWEHPNLARMYDYKFIEDVIFIVHEEFSSNNLMQRIKHGLSVNDALGYFLQILSGLQFLHQNKVVAGYITPKDILFRDDETLVLTNFGLIQKLNAVSQMTNEVPIDDLPFYVSPERIQGRQIDYRSDLYLAGVFLYEMLAGHPPYHVGSTRDILYSHVKDPAPSLPDTKSPLNWVIQGLMEKTPGKRYKSAEVASTELEKIMEKVSQ